jgi:hypothetical protein
MVYPRHGKLNGRQLELKRREWRKQNKELLRKVHERYVC